MTITTVIPAYNCYKWIARAIVSCLDCNEIIVVADKSDDGTIELIKKFPVRLIVREKNIGYISALNQGFRLASCDIVKYLDSDDMMMPNAHRYIREALVDHNWCYGGCVLLGEDGKYIGGMGESWDRIKLLSNCYIPACSVAWKKEFMEEVGYLNESIYGIADWDLWIRFSIADPNPYIINRFQYIRINREDSIEHQAVKDGRIEEEQGKLMRNYEHLK